MISLFMAYKRQAGNSYMFEIVSCLSKDRKKNILSNLLFFGMFIMEVGYLYFASSVMLVIGGILGGVTWLYVFKNNDDLLRLMSGLAAGIVVLVTINRLFVLNCGWSGCLRIVFISLPIAYLLCNVHINRNAALSFFYIVLIYTVINIALADPKELYRIFAASSRNYISVLLIASLFPYYVACQKDHMEVSVFPALLSLPVSIYVQSRGGMVVSGILVFFTFAQELYLGIAKGLFKSRKKLIRFLISAVLLLGIVFFAFQKSANDSVADEEPTDYLSRFVEPVEYPITRTEMWTEYVTVTGSSVKNILLGPPLTTCPFILAEGYNSHNSYFMVHSYMGIAGLVTILIGVIGYLVLCIKKKQYDLLFLSVTFLLRAMTDYLFPMLFCDCIVLFMILKTGIGVKKAAYEYKEKKALNNSDTGI